MMTIQMHHFKNRKLFNLNQQLHVLSIVIIIQKRLCIMQSLLHVWQDSNLQPSVLETDALADCATDVFLLIQPV